METTIQILLISLSLAMDSLSVSIAGGMSVHKHRIRDALKVAIFFGGFQALMPVLGWFIGESFRTFISLYAPWVAFGLLAVIGIKMIHESLTQKDHEEKKNILNNKTLFFLSIATSIDAFAVGITLGLIKLPLLVSFLSIGLVTGILCYFGYLSGKLFARLFGNKLEIAGGVILILIGIKIVFNSI